MTTPDPYAVGATIAVIPPRGGAPIERRTVIRRTKTTFEDGCRGLWSHRLGSRFAATTFGAGGRAIRTAEPWTEKHDRLWAAQSPLRLVEAARVAIEDTRTALLLATMDDNVPERGEIDQILADLIETLTDLKNGETNGR